MLEQAGVKPGGTYMASGDMGSAQRNLETFGCQSSECSLQSNLKNIFMYLVK